MKLLLVLILLVVVGVTLWYFREEISGEKVRFGARKEAGTWFRAPKWREASRDGNPTEGHLILKHKKHETRIFYLGWQYAKTPANANERTAAVKEFARVFREMTGSGVEIKPRTANLEVDGQPALVYAMTFEDTTVGSGELTLWYFPPNAQRFYLILVNDDPFELKELRRAFFDSFRAGRRTVEHAATTEGRLAFEKPLGWHKLTEEPGEVDYVSPQEKVLLQLLHGTRTNRTRMTNEYAASLTARMIEAVGGTWESRQYAIAKDRRLNTAVVRMRGVAKIEHTKHYYEIRLWISPTTKLLYTAAMSAEDAHTLDKFLSVFDAISSED